MIFYTSQRIKLKTHKVLYKHIKVENVDSEEGRLMHSFEQLWNVKLINYFWPFEWKATIQND